MTPEEKAKELVDGFVHLKISQNKEYEMRVAKECALICCEECIKALNEQRTFTGHKIHQEEFWQSVKKQIEIL